MRLNADARRARTTLAPLLRMAAEIEHAIACQYLFAAHSMKSHPVEPGCTPERLELLRTWKGTLLSIARMEMEHLGIVNNVLMAMGEDAHLGRPSFPTPRGLFPVEEGFSLEPFSLATLGRFVLIEYPHHKTARVTEFLGFLERDGRTPEDDDLRHQIGTGRDVQRNSISELYDMIEHAIEHLADNVAASLFIGDPTLQVTNSTLGFPPGVRIRDVELSAVDGKKAAVKILRRVRREGEGGKKRTEYEPLEHFPRLVSMYEALSEERRMDPAFDPARPVVSNPVAGGRHRASDVVTRVRDPLAKEVMHAHDLAYDTSLRLLAMICAIPSSDPTYPVVQNLAFMPMMTLVLRPLGELLTHLDAGVTPGAKAGAAFSSPPHLSTDSPATARRLVAEQLGELRARCAHIAKLAAGTRHASRFEFVQENTWVIASSSEQWVTGP
ncbi:MAG TPA: ferritin-like domain-containing protein [Acidimicrobiales bacterium]|nr:ferritin-like domain-containing protein [Acidimicrobiales bacterium]